MDRVIRKIETMPVSILKRKYARKIPKRLNMKDLIKILVLDNPVKNFIQNVR